MKDKEPDIDDRTEKTETLETMNNVDNYINCNEIRTNLKSTPETTTTSKDTPKQLEETINDDKTGITTNENETTTTNEARTKTTPRNLQVYNLMNLGNGGIQISRNLMEF